MMRPGLLFVPLVAACSFNSMGQPTGGSSPDPSGESTDTSAADTSAGPGSTSSPTTPTSSTAPESDASSGDPTADPTTSDPSTTAVDPGTTTDSTSSAPACGDGLVEGGEACDGPDLAGQTCADFGLVDGALACAGDCSVDLAGCLPPTTCNNGALDPGEACDGDDLGGQTCEDLGFFGGKLACADCVLDTAGCDPVPPDWFDEAYKKRRLLTIAKENVTGTHTDFPVALVTLDTGLIAGLGPADRLAFALPDKTQLAHELAFAEPNRLVAWVKLESLTDADDNRFYVYYGDPGAADTSDGPATWSNQFLAVWHLDEPLPDEQESGVHPDVTGAGHDGTQHDNQGNDSGCPVGRCQWFGPDDWIDLAKPQEFKLGNVDATIAVWIRTSNFSDRGIFAKSNPAMPEAGHMILGVRGGGKLAFEQNGVGSLDGTSVVTTGTFHYLVWTQTKDAMGSHDRWRLYVDGVEESTNQFMSAATKDPHLARIAGQTVGSPFPASFEGAIDEVQVSLDDRSAGWIATAHDNQRDPAGFTAWGPEETIP